MPSPPPLSCSSKPISKTSSGSTSSVITQRIDSLADEFTTATGTMKTIATTRRVANQQAAARGTRQFLCAKCSQLYVLDNKRSGKTETKRGGIHGASCGKSLRRMSAKALRWPLVHCILPLFIACLASLMLSQASRIQVNCAQADQMPAVAQIGRQNFAVGRTNGAEHPSMPQKSSAEAAAATEAAEATMEVPTGRESSSPQWPQQQSRRTRTTTTKSGRRRRHTIGKRAANSHLLPWALANGGSGSNGRELRASSLLSPISELRAVSGSKSEPPSRPSVDWNKQRPHFGSDMQRNVSVELGKTAYLTCKVFDLGDKTVSWLRPRENEILTAGRYTYIGDPRFSPINNNSSDHDWTLEIKDVTLNDSTSYECQVSTDPKMSILINLHVKAAKARIRQGEQYYAPLGSNIEFTCEIQPSTYQRSSSSAVSSVSSSDSSFAANLPSQHAGEFKQTQQHQTYWYYNGNLINYARSGSRPVGSGNSGGGGGEQQYNLRQNFSIEWDLMTQTSRLKLYAIQTNDSGNYTCKPISAEPATIRLHVKKSKSQQRDRVHYSGQGGYHVANGKEAQRTRQHYGLDSMAAANGLELGGDSSGARRAVGAEMQPLALFASILASCLMLPSFWPKIVEGPQTRRLLLQPLPSTLH